MSLQTFLVKKFQQWRPASPAVVSRSKRSVTMKWMTEEPFSFLCDQLLFRLERKEKMPPWVVVYSGGKTVTTVDNLAPSHPHKFRLKVTLKPTALLTLADRAIQFYNNEQAVYEALTTTILENDKNTYDGNEKMALNEEAITEDDRESDNGIARKENKRPKHRLNEDRKYVESQWSEETWTSTDSEGTSVVCFCMAVRCGYIKQLQVMLEERPELINIINSNNGFTPLATAVRKGDINTVRSLLLAGADIDQASANGQTALHLAVLAGNTNIIELLLEFGTSFELRDVNGLRVEHYAVDSCSRHVLRLVLDRGGDVTVRDHNGWTPLFRAVCQGARTEIIEELVQRGSNLDATDNAGLSLTAAARLLKNRHGKSRDSVLRIVDVQFPREKALANFTRLTKKISNMHSLLK